MRWRPTLGLAVVAAALVVVLVPSVSHATRPAGGGEIAFSARVHGISQLFTVRPNGTGLRQITHSAYDVGQYGLTWSPDVSSLLYTVTDANGNDRIFKLRANGSGGASQVTAPCTGTCLGDDFPTYSPDGKKITFERVFGTNGQPGWDAIFTMNADGSHLSQLTQTYTSFPPASEVHQPRWSPTGKEIAFVRLNDAAKPSNESAIEVMNADGSNLRRLTPWGMRASNPRWSPNGKRILFNTYAEHIPFKDSNLFTMRANGTDRMQLTHYTGGTLQGEALDWSPDGKQILFRRMAFSGTDTEVGGYYILTLHTRHIHRLTSVRLTYDSQAAWGK